jgi:hypothetical protein
MNDSELMTAVRESVSDVHAATQVEQIISRGRTVRAWRRIRSLAVALTAAAGAVVAIAALLPAGHPAHHQPGAELTAWTVTRRPGGDVAITIRQLFDPAGLQRELRAAGVPASVTFVASPRYPPSCRAYPASRAVLRQVFPPHPGAANDAIVIHPSALPPGAAVYLNDFSNPYGYIGLHLGLVHASQQCTGS